MLKTGKFLTLLLILNLFAAQNIFAQQKRVESLTPGSKAPSFTLPDANNNYVFLRDICGEKLRKPWKNKTKYVVVLSFFATWCAPCQKEIPHLMELQKQFAGRDIKFYLISVGEKKAKVLPFVRGKGYTLPLLIDQYQVVADKYGAHTLPRLVVIDKKGIVRRYNIGFENKANFETDLAALLSKLLAE